MTPEFRPRPARKNPGPGLLQTLFTPVDASSLGAFRILFGALMLWDVIDSFRLGRIAAAFLRPRFLFTYDALPFVAPWPGRLMYGHFALLGLAALGVTLGLCYRAAAVLFFLAYGYVFLLDKGQYNNHYYLIVLLSFLLCTVQAHRWASLDHWRRRLPDVVPYWNLLLLRLQIVIVFFYGGIAKLNPDWLGGEPMRTWLGQRQHTPVVGPWLASEAAAYFFSYAGLLFDLGAGPFLLWRRTRKPALVALLVFNLTNRWLFDIGVFPFLMLAAAILFVEPDLPRRLAARVGLRTTSAPRPGPRAGDASRPRAVLAFLAVYLAIQLALPLRHWLYPGYVGWTEEGQRFSWLMKLRSKSGRVAFRVTDPRSGQTWEIDGAADLNSEQYQRLAFSPDLIVQYARFLRRRFEQEGFEGVEVRADTWVSLNRRPPQRLVEPNVNLAALPAGAFSSSPVVPLDDNGRPGVLDLADYAALGGADWRRRAPGAPTPP